jgi:uncharacterized membrane protein
MIKPQQLRRELQHANTTDLRFRRLIIGMSMIGMASMAAVSLLQTGIMRHLPDPPLPSFDSDKVNSSDTAYALGVPDGTLSLASLAANVPIAAFGGADRDRKLPWIPVAAALKAGIEAAAAGWYFYQMPTKEKKWCGYCIAGAITNFTIFALSMPEALRAVSTLRKRV